MQNFFSSQTRIFKFLHFNINQRMNSVFLISRHPLQRSNRALISINKISFIFSLHFFLCQFLHVPFTVKQRLKETHVFLWRLYVFAIIIKYTLLIILFVSFNFLLQMRKRFIEFRIFIQLCFYEI